MDIRTVSPLVNITIFFFSLTAIEALASHEWLFAGAFAFAILLIHSLREKLRKALMRHDAEHERCIRRGVKEVITGIGKDEEPPQKYVQ